MISPYDKKILEVITDANYVIVTEYSEPKACWVSKKVSERMMLGDAKKLSNEQVDKKFYIHWVAHYKKPTIKI